MRLAGLTIFDWVLVALLVYSTVRAFLRGFLLEIFSIVGLFAGILLASWNYIPAAAALLRWIAPLTTLSVITSQIAAFILIALGVMIACGLAGKLLRSSADAIGLGFLDRLLGACFGLARGCLLGVALMMLFAVFSPETTWTENSLLAPYFLAGAHGVSFVVPQSLEQQLVNGTRQIANGAQQIGNDAQRLKHNATGWIKQPQ